MCAHNELTTESMSPIVVLFGHTIMLLVFVFTFQVGRSSEASQSNRHDLKLHSYIWITWITSCSCLGTSKQNNSRTFLLLGNLWYFKVGDVIRYQILFKRRLTWSFKRKQVQGEPLIKYIMFMFNIEHAWLKWYVFYGENARVMSIIS